MKKKLFYVLLLGLVLRLISLNQSFWLDEASTGIVAKNGLSHYFREYALGDFHPPLYYLVTIFFSPFDATDLFYKGLSVFFGVITLYYSYKIVTKITKKDSIGLTASLFLATSGLHIYYSQEARMYMLATLFATTSIYYSLKKSWKLYGISLAAMCLTHYVTVFMIPVFWIYAILQKDRKKVWKNFVSSHIFLVAGFLLWLPVFYKQFTGGISVQETAPLWWNILGKTTPKELLLVPAKFFFGRITIENDFMYAGAISLVGFIYAAIILYKHIKQRSYKTIEKEKIIWLWFFVPFVLTALLGFFIPVFNYFRVLFILPAFFILLAFGIHTLPKKLQYISIVFVLLINLVSTGVYLFNSRFHREDWRGLRSYTILNSVNLDTQNNKTALLFVADSQMEGFSYYQNYQGELDLSYCERDTCVPTHIDVITKNEITNEYKTLWLMRYVQPIFDPEDIVKREIEDMGYSKVSEHDFNGIVVWKYKIK